MGSFEKREALFRMKEVRFDGLQISRRQTTSIRHDNCGDLWHSPIRNRSDVEVPIRQDWTNTSFGATQTSHTGQAFHTTTFTVKHTNFDNTSHRKQAFNEQHLELLNRHSFPPTRLGTPHYINSSMSRNEEQRRNDLRWRSVFSGWCSWRTGRCPKRSCRGC